MLGVGWTEMLVIGVVALIVIGPKELPAVMQRIGRFAGTVRRMGADFQRELNKTTGLNEVKNLRNAITQPLKQTTDAIRKEFNATTASGKVEPSGVLKPADPKAESVVNEIHEAAGLPSPAEPAKAGAAVAAGGTAATAPVKAALPTPAEPVKAAGVTPIGPSSAGPPATAPKLDPPAKPKTPRKPRARKAVATPAPAEALPPAKSAAPKPARAGAPRKRKPAAKKTT